jgi:hypothetical protein
VSHCCCSALAPYACLLVQLCQQHAIFSHTPCARGARACWHLRCFGTLRMPSYKAAAPPAAILTVACVHCCATTATLLHSLLCVMLRCNSS